MTLDLFFLFFLYIGLSLKHTLKLVHVRIVIFIFILLGLLLFSLFLCWRFLLVNGVLIFSQFHKNTTLIFCQFFWNQNSSYRYMIALSKCCLYTLAWNRYMSSVLNTTWYIYLLAAPNCLYLLFRAQSSLGYRHPLRTYDIFPFLSEFRMFSDHKL
jgi:hypothetical protein